MYLKQIMRPYKSIRKAELQWQQCQRRWPRSSWLTAPWDAHCPCGTRLSVPRLPWLLLKIGSLAFLLILSMVHLKPFQKNLFLLNLFLLFVAANHTSTVQKLEWFLRTDLQGHRETWALSLAYLGLKIIKIQLSIKRQRFVIPQHTAENKLSNLFLWSPEIKYPLKTVTGV